MEMIDLFCGKERCEYIAQYVIEQKATVRKAAAHFRISKSTVHKDLVDTLSYVNQALYVEAQKVLQKNKSERHLRGGLATKQKYSRLSKDECV